MAEPEEQSGFLPRKGRVGPYEILGLLGQGGMAAVYLAHDTRTGDEVAVKVLARMRPSWVHRFAREFEAASRVNHPNVVRVLESGEHEGTAYFAMERVAGVTAQRHVLGLDPTAPLPPAPPMEASGSAEPLPPDQLLRTIAVGIQLTRAVAAIHRVGLVHRDLKPGNVLVDQQGVVKLVDFGVAKWLEEQSQFTQVGHVVGSYSYMSPEQITGAEVDHRADTYGMGVLLYELLSGAPPFRARRPQEYLWLHCTAQPEPLARRFTGVPPDLDALLLAMLHKEPADRPESMALIERRLLHLQAELEGVAAGARLELLGDDDPLPSREELRRVAARTAELDESTLRSTDKVLLDVRRRGPAPPAEREEPTEDDPFAKLAASLSQELSGPLTGPPIGAPSTAEVAARGATRTVSVLATAEPPPPPTRPPSGAALAALVTPRHVGRKGELDLLLQELKAARRDGARVVLLRGEEGLGKTRLLETFRGLAWVKGARVAIGRCHANGAFCGPFHDVMLRIAGPGLSRSNGEKILGPDRALLERLFPALASRGIPAGVGGIALAADLEDPNVIFRAVGEAFRRAAADAPLVVGLEDVHRADGGTLRLLRSLLTRLGPAQPARLLLVLTARSEELDRADAGPVSAAIAALPGLLTLALKPLLQDETAELIRSVTVDIDVDDALVQRLARAAEGNPRFAVEAARSIVESGGVTGDDDVPGSLRAAFKARMGHLGKPARDVARAVAVLGDAPPLAIVQAASGLDNLPFGDALSELERRRVATIQARRGENEAVALASEALRTTLLDGLTSVQARALHKRAAAAWLTAGRTLPGSSGQAARHLFAAGEAGAAFPHALDAAYLAGQQLDYATARRWMAQIGQAPDAHLDAVSEEAAHRFQMLRFRLAFMDGELDDAEEAITAAARSAPDDRCRLDTGVALARLHTRTGSYLAAVQVCRRGLRESRRAELPELAVLFATQGARAARRSGDIESALAWLGEADLLLQRNQELGSLAVRVAWTRSAVLLELQRGSEAEPEILRAVDLAQQTHQERAEAGLRTNLSVLYWRRGDLAAAVEQVERARRIFDELGELDQVALTETNLAELRAREGRLEEARALAQRAWITNRRLRDRQGTIVAAATALMTARVSGDRVLGDEVLRAVGDGPPSGRTVEAQWADFWLERGRWHQARAELDDALVMITRAEATFLERAPAHRRREASLLRAEVLVGRKDYEGARTLLLEVAGGAEEEGHRVVLWQSKLVLQAALAGLGLDPELAAPPLDLLTGNVQLALHALFWQREAAQLAGRRGEAQTLTERAVALARARGYADWLERLG